MGRRTSGTHALGRTHARGAGVRGTHTRGSYSPRGDTRGTCADLLTTHDGLDALDALDERTLSRTMGARSRWRTQGQAHTGAVYDVGVTGWRTTQGRSHSNYPWHGGDLSSRHTAHGTRSMLARRTHTRTARHTLAMGARAYTHAHTRTRTERHTHAHTY